MTIAILLASAAASLSFGEAGNWTVKANYGKRLSIDLGGVRNGAPCLYVGGPTSVCDTAWEVNSRPLSVPAGAHGWRLKFEAQSDHLVARSYVTGQPYVNELVWRDADGRTLACESLPFGISAGGFQAISMVGPVPTGAVSCVIKLGNDYPNLKPGERCVFRRPEWTFVTNRTEWVPPIALFLREGFPAYDGGSTGIRSELREDGVTLVDGKPFFPIGIFGVKKNDHNRDNYDTAFREIAEAGFNLAHTYGGDQRSPEFLSAAAKYGVRLWVKAREVDPWILDVGRRHPSVLAWYIGDDTCVNATPSELKAYRDGLRAVDPNRLTCQADGVGMEFVEPSYAAYVNGADVFMPEIYAVVGDRGDKTDVACVAKTISDMEMANRLVAERGIGRHACWPIIQWFRGWGMWRHFPTKRQLVGCTFAAIVHGARGVLWYTYGARGKNEGATSTPERWRDLRDLAGWLRELTPALVAPDGPQPSPAEVVSGPTRDPHGRTPVTALLRRVGDEAYLISVNAAPEPVTARFRLADVADSADVLRERRRVKTEEGVLEDVWDGFAVHVYRWRIR